MYALADRLAARRLVAHHARNYPIRPQTGKLLAMARSPARLLGPAGFTRDFFAGSASAVVPLPLERVAAPEGAPRVAYIADAIRKDALGWLFGPTGGGWAELQVVVGGRRRELRLWDERVFPRLDLRFSEVPLRLLVAAIESRWSPPELPAGVRAEPNVLTGDLIALHRIADRLLRLARGEEEPRCYACAAPLDVEAIKRSKNKQRACKVCGDTKGRLELEPPSPRGHRRRALIELSPLTQLFRSSEAQRDVPALRAALEPLFRGERPVILSYLARALSRAWLEEERGRRRSRAEAAEESYARSARLLEAYAWHCQRRPDALRPLIDFYRAYVFEFGGRVPVSEALREQSRSYDRVSERDAFLATASRLFEPGRAIQAAVDEALATPFVDRTEEQKILLSEYHERFRGEVAAEVEAIRRELAGEVG